MRGDIASDNGPVTACADRNAEVQAVARESSPATDYPHSHDALSLTGGEPALDTLPMRPEVR